MTHSLLKVNYNNNNNILGNMTQPKDIIKFYLLVNNCENCAHSLHAQPVTGCGRRCIDGTNFKVFLYYIKPIPSDC